MLQYLVKFSQLSVWGLLIAGMLSTTSSSAQSLPSTKNGGAPNSYIGTGGAIGLSGSTTSLGTGGLPILSKVKFTDNLSLHDATVLFGRGAATSMIILTADFPIRGDGGQTLFSPFIGAGTMLRYADGLYISPAVSGGVDIPLSSDLTGTIRLNAGFPSNSSADLGLLIGAGYTFGDYRP